MRKRQVEYIGTSFHVKDENGDTVILGISMHEYDHGNAFEVKLTQFKSGNIEWAKNFTMAELVMFAKMDVSPWMDEWKEKCKELKAVKAKLSELQEEGAKI